MEVQQIRVSRRAFDDKEFLGRPPLPEHYDHVVRSDADVYCDGELVAVYRRLDAKVCGPLLAAFKALKFGGSARVGQKTLKSENVVFGFSPRSPLRRNYCSACLLSREKPRIYEEMEKWAVRADDFIRLNAPDAYKRYKEQADTISLDWRIAGTVFTTGQINDSSAVRYHRDAADLKHTWNVITVLNHDVVGGYTVVPAFRVAFDAQGPIQVGFSTPDEVHGVTPIHRRAGRGYRYSMIFYTMKGMLNCGTPEEELKRVREWSTKTEQKVRSEI